MVVYVFELFSKTIYELAECLDGGAWEEVGRVMPDITPEDIEAIRKTEHPTESLLKVWGSKGYKIVDLFKVFGLCQYAKCTDILKPFVDPKFHNITLTTDRSILSPKSVPQSDNVLQKSELTQQSVYSKRTPSQIEPLLISQGESIQSSSEIFSGLHTIPAVKYEDILVATDNFAPDNICGRGGYGVVYKGVWKHMAVAVKTIKARKEGAEFQKERIRQSLQELRHLSKLRHDNILSIYGYSMDGPEPCLIYQYMPGGSLEDRILCRNNTKPLNWDVRLSICIGSALGLHFLHSIGTAPIIHGDVKCANILLDKHMEPKIGDFGLSRDGQVELDANMKNPMIASHIKGTLAYLPPEFTTSKILTTKLDVYSFGVVLMEVATGLRAYNDKREHQSIVKYVNYKVLEVRKKHGTDINTELSDKKIETMRKSPEEAIFLRILNLGIKCAVEDRFKRPSFSEIVLALQST